MFETDCVYIPSDSVHSKNASTYITSPIKKVVVSHKGQKSFDRSTRRSSRSTQQIWSNYVSNGDSNVSSVYLVCESITNKASMHERLAKEFESIPEFVSVETPNKVVNAMKCNVDCKGDGLNLIFLDLDSLSPPVNETSISELQTLLESIVGKLVEEKQTLIHIKSDVISRAIISMLSDAKMDNSQHANGEELKVFLDIQEQEVIKSHLTGDLIRRLNNKNVSSNCPLTNYPARYIQCSLDTNEKREICRFYNYDKERGCLRSIKAQRNQNIKGCDLDHEHCHSCGNKGHKAFECTNNISIDVNKSLVFQKTEDGGIIAVPNDTDDFAKPKDVPVPSLLVLGGRCRGRTLNSCEFLPLSSSAERWTALPNLQKHRGSHAACTPEGSKLVFVMGGGGVDGNLDTVELLDLRTSQQLQAEREFKWNIMSDTLSSARHAFGAVCVTNVDKSDVDEVCVDLFAVGGWMYGTKSCESMEKLSFKVPQKYSDLERNVQWEKCSHILTPRRLHSVAASVDGCSIFVFGGYVDERKVTSSIETYDIRTDTWSATDELPYSEESCPLVQAVPDWSPDAKNSFIIFPYSDSSTNETCTPAVLRYTPSSCDKFEPIVIPTQDGTRIEHLQMPIKNWHSFSATVSPSLQQVYIVGGLIDSKWTGRGFSLDLSTMKWQELPEMSLPRRRLTAIVLE